MLKILKITLISIIISMGLINPIIDNIPLGYDGSSISESLGVDLQIIYSEENGSEAANSNSGRKTEFALQAAIRGGAYIINVLFYLNWMAISMLSILMDNMTVYHPQVVPFLKGIWLIVRNLVNVCFAIALVAMAVKSIFKGEGIGGIGKSLGIFILAVVFVNMSWFVVKVFVDFGTVVTNIVYRIPMDFGNSSLAFEKGKVVVGTQFNYLPDEKDNRDSDNCSKGKDVKNYDNLFCYVDLESGAEVPESCSAISSQECNPKYAGSDSKGEKEKVTPDNSMLILFVKPLADAKKDFMGAQSIANAIALNYIPLEEMYRLGEGTGKMSTVIFETIFSMLLVIMSAITFISVAIVMLERLVMLWIGMMISPFSALALVLEDLGVPLGQFTFTGLIGKLATYAIAIPAGVGLVFIISFLMIGQIYFTTGINSSFANGIGGVWSTIMGLIALGILWKGTFAVFEKSDVLTKGVVDGIKAGAEGMVKATGSNLLYYTPVPMGKSVGGDVTTGNLGALTDQFKGLKDGGMFGGAKADYKRETEIMNKGKYSADIKMKLDDKFKKMPIELKELEGIIKDKKSATDVGAAELQQFVSKLDSLGDVGAKLKGDKQMQVKAFQQFVEHTRGDGGKTFQSKEQLVNWLEKMHKANPSSGSDKLNVVLKDQNFKPLEWMKSETQITNIINSKNATDDQIKSVLSLLNENDYTGKDKVKALFKELKEISPDKWKAKAKEILIRTGRTNS